MYQLRWMEYNDRRAATKPPSRRCWMAWCLSEIRNQLNTTIAKLRINWHQLSRSFVRGERQTKPLWANVISMFSRGTCTTCVAVGVPPPSLPWYPSLLPPTRVEQIITSSSKNLLVFGRYWLRRLEQSNYRAPVSCHSHPRPRVRKEGSWLARVW